MWGQPVKDIFSRFVHNEKFPTLILRNGTRQRKWFSEVSLDHREFFCHTTPSTPAEDDGCRDARPILWCSSVSLQLDVLTLLQSVCGHTGDASMSAAHSHDWVSETWGGTWRFGLCQDGFWKQVREMLSCLLASWLFLGCDTARMLVEESI